MVFDVMIFICWMFAIVLIILIIDAGATYSIYKTIPIMQYIIHKKSKPNIEKIVKGDWYITKIRRGSVARISKDRYRIFVKVRNDTIIGDNHNWSCDFVKVDSNGKILDEDLTHSCNIFEKYARTIKKYKSNNVRDD